MVFINPQVDELIFNAETQRRRGCGLWGFNAEAQREAKGGSKSVYNTMDTLFNCRCTEIDHKSQLEVF